jgi:hypothetical protein
MRNTIYSLIGCVVLGGVSAGQAFALAADSVPMTFIPNEPEEIAAFEARFRMKPQESPPSPPAPAPPFVPYWSLTLSADLHHSRISSTDRATGGSATYNSNLDPGVSVCLDQHWSRRFETYVGLDFRSAAFVAPSNASTGIDDGHLLTGFGAGLRFAPLEPVARLWFDARIGAAQQLFTRATSMNSVTLDPILIPQVELGPRYLLLDRDPFSLELHAGADFYLPSSSSSYTVRPGYGYGGGVEIARDLSRKIKLSGGFWSVYRSQNSSIATQNQTDFGLTLGITFNFGNGR